MFSTLQLLSGRRALFAGVAVAGKPGSIQAFKFDPDFEKLFEVQAHSLPVSKLCLNADQTSLFSASSDGTVAFFSIHDRDSRKKEREAAPIVYANEILIPKDQRDKTQQRIKDLELSIAQEKKAKRDEQESMRFKNEKKIEELEKEIENKKIDALSRFEQLEQQKFEKEREYQEKLQQMIDNHQNLLEKKLQD